MTTIIKHLDDIGYTVKADYKDADLFVEFDIYQIEGKDLNGVRGYESQDDDESSVTDLSDAAIFIAGSVKWDGCSNWRFDEQDRGWIHGCSRADLVNMGEVMARCRDLAATLIPKWCGR